MLAEYEAESEWPWSLSKEDFENVAGLNRAWITVWATGDAAYGELSEDTNVESALVPHEAARALLFALQTSPLGPQHVGIIPTTNDRSGRDERLDEWPFELLPWVDATKYHSGIDERDNPDHSCRSEYTHYTQISRNRAGQGSLTLLAVWGSGVTWAATSTAGSRVFEERGHCFVATEVAPQSLVAP